MLGSQCFVVIHKSYYFIDDRSFNVAGMAQEGGKIRRGLITGLYPLQHDIKLIQTDISVQMDDTGNAVVDAEGHVIGIISSALTTGLSTACATSINTAKNPLMSFVDVSVP